MVKRTHRHIELNHFQIAINFVGNVMQLKADIISCSFFWRGEGGSEEFELFSVNECVVFRLPSYIKTLFTLNERPQNAYILLQWFEPHLL